MTTIDPWKKKVDLFRSRFVARQDRFLVSYPIRVKEVDKVTGEETWVEKKWGMPACSNYGKPPEICLLMQKPRGSCGECSHRDYTELTDKEIWKHLSGEQEIILLMMREEGIRFGVVDFDRGTVFEDAKNMRDLSLSFGVPCYIAKSTSKGYHIYWFFSDFIVPTEFTSYIRHLFEELGFFHRYQVTPEAGMPEVFPKQRSYDVNGTGNGIKVPMNDMKMREGRNCWMDDFEAPLPLDKQWDYLESTQLILPADFRNVLQVQNVEILQAPASQNRQKARKAEGKDEGKLAIKQFGDFWSIVEGCPAMQQYWAKDETGKFAYDSLYPDRDGKIPQENYYSSIQLAVNTKNGIDIVKKRWNDAETAKKIDFAIAAGYAPMSCKTMQFNHACTKGLHPKYDDHCLKRLAPVVYEEGVRKINPEGLSEDLWPDPSPIRFAEDRHLSADDIIGRLSHIFKALKARSKTAKAGEAKDADVKDYLPDNPEERIKALLRCAKRLGAEDYKRIESHITSNKWMKVSEMKAHEKEFKKEQAETKDQTRRKTGRSFKSVGGNEFFLQNNCYVRTWRDNNGIKQEEIITNFHILIHEELTLLRAADGADLNNAESAEDRGFRGTIYVGNEKIPFDVNYREWTGSSDTFFRTLTQLAGSKLQYNRPAYDHIRNCINGFSQEQIVHKKVSRQIGHHTLKGQDVYIMPSVMIDKESIRPNEEFGVEVFADDFSKSLDFKILDEEEFKDLAQHIVADYFTCNNAVLTMTTFAHAMASVILPQVEVATGFNKSPVLWLGGSFSGGKTFVAEAAQNFFGVFKMVQSASGTAKSKLANGYNCRHAFMLIDDYKRKLVDQWGTEMPGLIQVTYDRGGRPALDRNGVQRKKVDRVRGLLCVTGEDIVENESSAISRLLLVDVPFKENLETGGRVKMRRTEYNGFTPYFIQFCLGLPKEEIKTLWDEYYQGFYNPVAKTHRKVSPNRICENLALNMLAFRLCMDMLVARGAIPEVQRDELCRTHNGNLVGIRGKVLKSVNNATGATVFLGALKELIQDAAHYEIAGWRDTMLIERNSGCKPIGFWREKTPDVIYIYPQIAHGLVSDMMKKNTASSQVVSHVARQLFEEGHLGVDSMDVEDGRYSVQIRSPNKSVVRVWPVKCESLGFEIPVADAKSKVRRESGGNQGHLKVVSDDEPEL
jgi:hypothetical protein